MQTTLYQLELDYTNIDCGMSYVFHLQDGRFFIIDGGYYTPGEEDRLYNFLKELTAGNEPVIAAWFFSHAHDDHIGNFVKFIWKYGKKVIIDKLIYNFQPINLPESGAECDWQNSGAALVKAFYETIDEHCRNVPIYTPQTGDIFRVGEITVEVLYTYNDLKSDNIMFNDCSTVITTEYAGQKILWLGDIDKEGSNILIRDKKEKLVCDIIQVSHHGFSGATLDVYAATQAKAALWPTPDYLMEDIKNNTTAVRTNYVNLFVLNEMNIKDHWIGGYGTVGIKLPYRSGETESFPKKFYGCSEIYITNKMHGYTTVNAHAIDKWVEDGWEWSIPVSHDIFVDALNGNWDVLLTPVKPVPHEWFLPYLRQGRFDDVKLLGLASGGGQQMPIFTALGADCTVLDYSERQLDREREVAERENYKIEIVKADMTQRLPFDDSTFDIIFHPVSNCYIEDVYHVWNECYRVLKPGGILLAGMDNGFNFIIEDFSVRPLVIANTLPYNPLKNPEHMKHTIEENESIQFSHTFDEQIGGQLKAGFIITAAYEDFNNEPDAIADGIASFWATKAVKM